MSVTIKQAKAAWVKLDSSLQDAEWVEGRHDDWVLRAKSGCCILAFYRNSEGILGAELVVNRQGLE